MILKELLERSEYNLVQGSEDVEISTLVYDSRKIEKGSVFVCISGAAFDGHKFVAQAAELGAAAVVVEKDVEVPENLTVIKFDNTRLALAEMSAAYFGCNGVHFCRIFRTSGRTAQDHRNHRNQRKDNNNVYDPCSPRTCRTENRIDRND